MFQPYFDFQILIWHWDDFQILVWHWDTSNLQQMTIKEKSELETPDLQNVKLPTN